MSSRYPMVPAVDVPRARSGGMRALQETLAEEVLLAPPVRKDGRAGWVVGVVGIDSSGQGEPLLHMFELLRLSLPANTVEAYGRGVEDFLAFCARRDVEAEGATRAAVVGWVRDLRRRPDPRRANVVRTESLGGLSDATIHQRLTSPTARASAARSSVRSIATTSTPPTGCCAYARRQPRAAAVGPCPVPRQRESCAPTSNTGASSRESGTLSSSPSTAQLRPATDPVDVVEGRAGDRAARWLAALFDPHLAPPVPDRSGPRRLGHPRDRRICRAPPSRTTQRTFTSRAATWQHAWRREWRRFMPGAWPMPVPPWLGNTVHAVLLATE